MNRAIFSNHYFKLLFVFVLLSSCHFEDNQRTDYYKSNKLKSKYEVDSYNLPHGEYINYYESGEIKKIRHYFHGKLIDTLFHYYKNGKLKEKGKFVNCEPIGWWIDYDSLNNSRLTEYVINNNSSFCNQIICYKNDEIDRNNSFFL